MRGALVALSVAASLLLAPAPARAHHDECYEYGECGYEDGRGGDGGGSGGHQGYGGGGGRSGDYDGGPGDDCRTGCNNTIIIPDPRGGEDRERRGSARLLGQRPH